MLRVLTTASSPVEQSLLLARLSDAGIRCMRGAGGARAALGSGRDILVEEEDLTRAEEILKEDDEGFDEEELARLSEEAGRQTAEENPPLPQPAPEDQPDAPTPVAAQAPAARHGLKAFERLTRDKHKANSPFGR
jgi:putative signal transducing protein